MARTDRDHQVQQIQDISQMETEEESEEVLVGESEINEMKEEVGKLLNKIVKFECNKKIGEISQQLEEKNGMVEALQNEKLSLCERVVSLNNELEIIKSLRDQQRLRLSEREVDFQTKLDEVKKENETLTHKVCKLTEKLEKATDLLETANNNSIQLGEDRLKQETKIQNLESKVKELEQFKQKSKPIYELHQRMHQLLESGRGNDDDDGEAIGVLEAFVPSTPPIQVSGMNESMQTTTSSEEPVTSTSRGAPRSNQITNYNVLNDGTPRPFICNICGRNFPKERFLKSHKTRMHRNLRPFGCTVCGRNFPKERFLKSHKTRMHRNAKLNLTQHVGTPRISSRFAKRPRLSSTQSFRSSSIRIGLEFHSVDESSPDVPRCICTKTFKDRQNLKYHVRLYGENNRPFACSICPKRYVVRGALRLHEKIIHFMHQKDTPNVEELDVRESEREMSCREDENA